jgi:hypothetical protein
MNKKALFTYGRMNPPTVGHKALVKRLINNAKTQGADPFIVVTHTQNKKKNPLTQAEKIEILEKMFPGVPILGTSKAEPNPRYIVNKLKNMGYTNIQMMVGSNRVNNFGFVGVPVVSGGQRDPNANNTTGASATKAREAARAKNFQKMRVLMNNSLSNQEVKNIMNIVLARLK